MSNIEQGILNDESGNLKLGTRTPELETLNLKLET
jgi:hypothetical protein